MNRRWFPGAPGENFADRQVRALQPVAGLADAMIDLHCHEYLYTPMALTDMTDATCAQLALAMGLPFVNDSSGSEGMFGPYCRNVLNKPVVTVEMPPLRRVDHRHSTLGFQGVMNALRFLGMIDDEPVFPAETVIFEREHSPSRTITAEHEGFLARYCTPGDAVAEGQLLAETWGPADFTVVQTARAPFAGHVVSLGAPPRYWGDPEQDFVNFGDRIVTVRTPTRVIRRQPE
jgi:predicted deacylase